MVVFAEEGEGEALRVTMTRGVVYEEEEGVEVVMEEAGEDERVEVGMEEAGEEEE